MKVRTGRILRSDTKLISCEYNWDTVLYWKLKDETLSEAMKRKTYEAAGVTYPPKPFTYKSELFIKYIQGTKDYIFIVDLYRYKWEEM